MVRQRLTITLDPKILKKIDSFIDGKKIRNRSHAIEYLVKSNLPLSVKKAVILAGGPGVHFRPLTYEIPNLLIPFKGKPLLVHLINQIKRAGINQIILCVGYLSERIVDSFGDGREFGIKITYSYDGPRPLGTAGALLKARRFLGKSPFLVIHGDVISEIDFSDMINFHEEKNYLATLALTTVKNPQRCGVVRVKGIRVKEFLEKPPLTKSNSHLVHAGVYILENQAFDYFPRKKKMMMEKDVFPKLIKADKVAAYLLAGQWFDISYPQFYEKALKVFKFRKG